MNDKNEKVLNQAGLTTLLKGLQDASTKKIQPQTELPDFSEVIEKLMTTGTMLKYSDEKILFNTSPQTSVKSLEVNICSMESQDMAVLHTLHTRIKNQN